MSNIAKSTKAEVLRIIFYQFIMLLGFAVIMLLLKGMYKSLSVLAGAIAYWLPTTIFMLRTASHVGVHATSRFLIAFFLGEAVKLLLCGALFVIIIKYLNAQLLYAVMGLIASIIAFWIASMVVVFQKRVNV